MQIDELVERLEEAGFRVRAYRGRFMAADTCCVGAIVESIPDLAFLGPELRPGLAVDTLALEFIAYWPKVLLPADHELVRRPAEGCQFAAESGPVSRVS